MNHSFSNIPEAPPCIHDIHYTRFSESKIWNAQRHYYQNGGPALWGSKEIPYHITSNAQVAQCYAHLIESFLKDYRNSSYPQTEKFYVVELGAGHGQLGFFLVRELWQSLRSAAGLNELEMCYVLTDFCEQNIEAWQKHPRLRRYFEDGLLDCAHFDVLHDDVCQLRGSGTVLKKGGDSCPLIILCNYIFDSIPQDVFRIEAGEIKECYLGLTGTGQGDSQLEAESSLLDMELHFQYRPINNRRYEDESKNAILQNYSARMMDSTITFPNTAMDALARIRAFTTAPSLVLLADKAFSEESSWRGDVPPDLVLHGNSFSMMVNLHALSQHFASNGGTVLNIPDRQFSISIMAMVGGLGEDIEHTKQAYAKVVESFSPDDFYVLQSLIESRADELQWHELVANLRWCHWSSVSFSAVLPGLISTAEENPVLARRMVRELAAKVWDNHFYLPQGDDIAYMLGILLYTSNYWNDALGFFTKSLACSGEQAETYHYMSLCYFRLESLEMAIEYNSKVLALAPGHDKARAFSLDLEKE
ncbi:SAM-dependent methyltransferase [Thalassomonas actiniarum]|uniref:SAM-dependent methyltransferase n=1 Tax=Thalassomonas actiniarum TaxID=485447 RepID=A0AAF0C6C1_9GAMM|nr:SAM-dependent methyltransferase [Thalassomonas actiniarum]WDE02086.1 SAM-dependent methyltransferase [Thalassomonas actiniarum]